MICPHCHEFTHPYSTGAHICKTGFVLVMGNAHVQKQIGVWQCPGCKRFYGPNSIGYCGCQEDTQTKSESVSVFSYGVAGADIKTGDLLTYRDGKLYPIESGIGCKDQRKRGRVIKYKCPECKVVEILSRYCWDVYHRHGNILYKLPMLS